MIKMSRVVRILQRNKGILFMLLGVIFISLYLSEVITRTNFINLQFFQMNLQFFRSKFNEDEPEYQDGLNEKSDTTSIRDNFYKKICMQNINNPISAKDGVWQSVRGSRFKFFLYSAFYDWRGPQRVVRIIGVTNRDKIEKDDTKAWCLLWYNTTDNLNLLGARASTEVIEEHWSLNYSACFILCPLKDEMDAPHSVSIVKTSNLTASNRLLINNAYPGLRPQPPPPPDKLAVCVKTIHSKYNKTLQLLEFIELNTILGMHHFTFYNSSISPTISCILNHYIREGRATVLPWKPNLMSMSQLRIEAMFVAINDCVYRSMYRFSYVVVIDVDEIIIPRFSDTIQQLFEWIRTTIGSYSLYLFRNHYFYLHWPDYTSLSEDPFENRINSLRKTTSIESENQRFRTKYICRPEMVIEAGNHFVWRQIQNYSTFSVPNNIARMHHYRYYCKNVTYDCNICEAVTDRTAHRYKTRLLERVKAKWTELKTECSLPNIEDI